MVDVSGYKELYWRSWLQDAGQTFEEFFNDISFCGNLNILTLDCRKNLLSKVVTLEDNVQEFGWLPKSFMSFMGHFLELKKKAARPLTMKHQTCKVWPTLAWRTNVKALSMWLVLSRLEHSETTSRVGRDGWLNNGIRSKLYPTWWLLSFVQIAHMFTEKTMMIEGLQ